MRLAPLSLVSHALRVSGDRLQGNGAHRLDFLALAQGGVFGTAARLALSHIGAAEAASEGSEVEASAVSGYDHPEHVLLGPPRIPGWCCAACCALGTLTQAHRRMVGATPPPGLRRWLGCRISDVGLRALACWRCLVGRGVRVGSRVHVMHVFVSAGLSWCLVSQYLGLLFSLRLPAHPPGRVIVLVRCVTFSCF